MTPIRTRIIIVAPAIRLIQNKRLRFTTFLKSPTIEVSSNHQVAAPKKTPHISKSCPDIPTFEVTTPKPAKNAIKRKTARGFENVSKKVDI
jgi:hypothetical protein